MVSIKTDFAHSAEGWNVEKKVDMECRVQFSTPSRSMTFLANSYNAIAGGSFNNFTQIV